MGGLGCWGLGGLAEGLGFGVAGAAPPTGVASREGMEPSVNFPLGIRTVNVIFLHGQLFIKSAPFAAC